ncbi:MAG: DUF5683 domain-containing protein [Chitinophagales bacterium]|nr:hypothetical protein [Bacteroidota bacterium]
MKVLFVVTGLFFASALFAQTDTITTFETDTISTAVIDTALTADSLKTPFYKNLWSHDPHSVGRAALYSAIIPGLGQAYNGKYWKIPIVYGAIGTAGYFIYYWYDFYDELKTAYIYRTDEDPLTIDYLYDYIATDEYLLQKVSQAKQYTDLMVVLTAAAYLLNIVDAVVDAHLYDFNVSDDLSLNLQPYFPVSSLRLNSMQPAYGVTLKLYLK